MNVSRDFYKFVKRCIICSTLKKQKTCTVFLSSFSINILAFYHECRFVIGYATIYSVIDSEQRSCVIQRPLLAVFEESVKRIQISKVLNDQQIYTKTIRSFSRDFYRVIYHAQKSREKFSWTSTIHPGIFLRQAPCADSVSPRMKLSRHVINLN